MAAIITDKDTTKQFVRINFINAVSSLPDFELAEQRYLVPITGQDLLDDLKANIAEVAYADLLKLCRAVIAPLGYVMELPYIQTQLTDAGLRSISTEHAAAAHRWEYNEIKDGLEDKGAYSIEALLKYLFKQQYALWTDSNEYKELDKLIFKSGAEFDKFFKLHQPHRVFWELRPLIAEVQDLYIISSIGETFFLELKNAATPDADQTTAILLMKKAVAQFAIAKSVEKLLVRKTVKGFTIMMSAGNTDSVNSGDSEHRAPELDLLYKTCINTGDAYLLQLKEFLNTKASATVFNTYYTSSYYTSPTATVCDRNKDRKIFGL